MKKLLLTLLLLFGPVTGLHAQAPFYQGKTITFIVGSGSGTAYDIYSRLLAAYIGKHLPGNPTVVVQNMPAAGGLVAANYVYGVAKPDGLTLVSINPAHYFNQLQGNKEVKFDWTKFTWLASSDKSEHMLYMRADAPYKTIQDIRKATEPPKCGATGTGTSGHYIPRMLEEALGTKFTDRYGLCRRQRNRFGHRAKRSRVPFVYHCGLFRAGALPYLAQEKLCPDTSADGAQTRPAIAGDAPAQ